MQIFGQRVGPAAIIIPAQSGRIRIEVRRHGPEPAPVVAAEVGRFLTAGFIEQHELVAVSIALRMVVILPDHRRVVSGFAHGARLLDWITARHGNHLQHAVIPWRESGQ
jgi:hypothetical protein